MLLGTGCGRCDGTRPPLGDAAAPHVPAPAASASAGPSIDTPADAGDGARLGIAGIGFAKRPVRPSPRALQANNAAFERHKAGDFDASSAGFAGAIALAPDFALARYNLACARARRGAFAEAREELDKLLSADLVELRDRIDADPDLEAFRASAEMPTLRARIAVLEAAYALARKEGVPAVLFEVAEEGNVGATVPVTKQLRVGAYHARAGRFVPLLPVVDGAMTGFADFEHGFGLVIKTAFSSSCGVVCHPLTSPAEIVAASLNPSVHSKLARASYAMNPLSGLDLAITAWATNDGAAFTAWETWSQATSVTKVVLGTSKKRAPMTLHVVGYRGGRVSMPSSSGWRVEGGAVTRPDGRTIPLSKELAGLRAYVRAAPDGTSAVLVSEVDICECAPFRQEFRHVVSRIDLVTEQFQTLSKAHGVAYALYDDAGNLFLQTGSTFEVIRAGSLTREKLFEGVLFTVPLGDPTCCSA
jgi:hypothetical protein